MQVVHGVTVIVSVGQGDGGSSGHSGDAVLAALEHGRGCGEDIDLQDPCLNYAGYPSPFMRWAQYCRWEPTWTSTH